MFNIEIRSQKYRTFLRTPWTWKNLARASATSQALTSSMFMTYVDRWYFNQGSVDFKGRLPVKWGTLIKNKELFKKNLVNHWKKYCSWLSSNHRAICDAGTGEGIDFALVYRPRGLRIKCKCYWPQKIEVNHGFGSTMWKFVLTWSEFCRDTTPPGNSISIIKLLKKWYCFTFSRRNWMHRIKYFQIYKQFVHCFIT